MLTDMLARLLNRHLNDTAHAAARSCQWLPDLWTEIEEMGLPLALLGEDRGGFGLSLADQGDALRLLGRHAMPLPVAETMAANLVLGSAGLPLAEGAAWLTGDERLDVDGDRLRGRIARVGWADHLDCVAVAADGRTWRIPRSAWQIVEYGQSLAFHPRQTIEIDYTGPSAPTAVVPLNAGATVRALQIAGALEAVLDLTLDHTASRVQFGKPLAKLQAIQHELAKLAGELACATAAGDLALEALARGDWRGIAAGSLRAREAAGAGAAIATQCHGAIGFTREHRLHLFTTQLWTWRDEFGGQVRWARRLGQAALAAGAPGYWPLVTEL